MSVIDKFSILLFILIIGTSPNEDYKTCICITMVTVGLNVRILFCYYVQYTHTWGSHLCVACRSICKWDQLSQILTSNKAQIIFADQRLCLQMHSTGNTSDYPFSHDVVGPT